MNKLTKEELKAVEYSLKELNLHDVWEDNERRESWLNDGTISLNEARNGREIVWILTDAAEIAVYVDGLQELTKEEIAMELM